MPARSLALSRSMSPDRDGTRKVIGAAASGEARVKSSCRCSWRTRSAGGSGSRSGVEQRRRLARDLDEPVDRTSRRGSDPASPSVRMLRLAEENVDGSCSTTSPAYMTTTSSAVSATTPRSCVIMMIALPKSSCSLFISSRICACVSDVESGRRLVGDQEIGVVDERHRDHHALTHAAGELVRIVVDPALGARNADRLQQVERTCRACRFETSWWSRTASISWFPISAPD